ncbi:MAG: hypothetical protein AAGI69_13090 [Cyanobacteria bacterium P01_H01_bin.21]
MRTSALLLANIRFIRLRRKLFDLSFWGHREKHTASESFDRFFKRGLI